MQSKYSWQYRTLKQIGEGEVVELWPEDELERILQFDYIDTARYIELVKLFIKGNKYGNAPSRLDAWDSLDLNYSAIGPYTKSLEKKKIIVGPSCMEYADILGVRRGTRSYFRSGPRNVEDYLKNFRKHGPRSGFSWKKRRQPEHLRSSRYRRFYIALVFDDKGPVYQNCFPELELGFVPREIKKVHLTN